MFADWWNLDAPGLDNEDYTQAMIDAVDEFGPYMVLAPGLALAHARPEDGVLDIGVSLVTLDPPVNFGSKANDPVNLVIAFCAVDKTGHTDMLARLAMFLEDERRREQLASTSQPDMITRALQEFEQG